MPSKTLVAICSSGSGVLPDSHYLRQCGLTINETNWHLFQTIVYFNAKDTYVIRVTFTSMQQGTIGEFTWVSQHIALVECVSNKRHIISVIHYIIRGAVCFQFTHFPCDDWENIYTLSYYHHQIGSMNYCPLFRVRSWNNGVRCLFIFSWICNTAGLHRGTFVSWWYLPRIWPSVTDIQHNYHVRYPTDDWHLTLYVLTGIFFRRSVPGRRVSPLY